MINTRTVSSPMQTLAALRELVQALDRRHPHAHGVNELGIAKEARLLRHQAIAQMEELQIAQGEAEERNEAELVNAIMTDDGGPPSSQ